MSYEKWLFLFDNDLVWPWVYASVIEKNKFDLAFLEEH